MEEEYVTFHFGPMAALQEKQDVRQEEKNQQEALALALNLKKTSDESKLSYELIMQQQRSIARKKIEAKETYDESLKVAEAAHRLSLAQIPHLIQIEQDELIARDLQETNGNRPSPITEELIAHVAQSQRSAVELTWVELQRDIFRAYMQSLRLLDDQLDECKKQQIRLDELAAQRLGEELNGVVQG